VRPATGQHPTALRSPGAWRKKRWLVAAPLAVALVLLTWMLAFGLTRNPGEVRSAMIGRRAPGFALRTLDGTGTVRFADLRGQVVVINFWASWCADCVTEHPALAAAWHRFRDQGVTVVGVLYEDSPAPAERFLTANATDWPQVLDPGERTSIAYGVRGVPETFFVSRGGRVAAQHSGPVTYGLLSNEIARLLGVPR